MAASETIRVAIKQLIGSLSVPDTGIVTVAMICSPDGLHLSGNSRDVSASRARVKHFQNG